MILFHGGCHGCTQQEKHSTDFCIGCKWFMPDWSLPDLNNKSLTESEIEKNRLIKKFRLSK